MFSKQDFLSYFGDIDELEKVMEGKFKNMADCVDDPVLKKQFLELQSDEQRHQRVVQNLQELFE